MDVTRCIVLIQWRLLCSPVIAINGIFDLCEGFCKVYESVQELGVYKFMTEKKKKKKKKKGRLKSKSLKNNDLLICFVDYWMSGNLDGTEIKSSFENLILIFLKKKWSKKAFIAFDIKKYNK